MVDINQILELVIRPALQITGLHSLSAERLMLFTGMVESGYTRIAQIKGPALGVFQVEPRTHEDIKKWLNRTDNRRLKESVLAASYMEILPDEKPLIWNMRYGCLIARILYYRYTEPLPDADDAENMSRYHFRYFNGNGLGKADKERNAGVYREMFGVK